MSKYMEVHARDVTRTMTCYIETVNRLIHEVDVTGEEEDIKIIRRNIKKIINNTVDKKKKDKANKLYALLSPSFKFVVKYENHKCEITTRFVTHRKRQPGMVWFPSLGISYNSVLNALVKDNPYVKIKNGKEYEKLVSLLEECKDSKEYDMLFDEDGKLLDQYKRRDLSDYNLTETALEDKNISGLDVSKNLNIHINFDKIVKDVSGCNFSGYDLSKETFKNFNIIDTDFRNTGATIDIASCIISEEGKMNSGTLFDTSNKFIFGSKELTSEDVERIGIKIYRKEK